MNKLSREKRNQLMAVAAATLALCGVLWYLVVRPKNAELQKTDEAVADAQNKIEKAQRLVKRRSAIDADLAQLHEQIAQVEAEMLPVEQLTGKKWIYDKLLNFIKDRYDVTLMNLSNDALIGKQFLLLPKFDPYSTAAYTVELRAFFHEFGKFIADFENRFPYLRIQNLKVWPLATPMAAAGPSADVPEELLNSDAKEQLRISMSVVVLYKPAGVM
ncbi:MAG: hypothetical protein HY735_10180 [Verrucomicrobia bacterium]|nr:hypothetical protein [Verrucomicrobiota bacterium]